MIRIPGVTGVVDLRGNVRLHYNPHTTGKFVSRDGTKHVLLCDLCADVYWVDLRVLSFACPKCASRYEGMNRMKAYEAGPAGGKIRAEEPAPAAVKTAGGGA